MELDVRGILKAKGNPLKVILDAADSVPIGDTLNLHTPFKPTPLYRVMRKRGFSHTVVHVEKGHFVTRFVRSEDPI